MIHPPHGYRENLTTTGAGQAKDVHFASIHVWQIRNNSSAQATVRPQGSLAEEKDSLAALWTSLGAADTNIAIGAVGMVAVFGVPLARARLNVVTLADGSLDVIYVGCQE